VCSNNLNTLDELKQCICGTIMSIKISQLKLVSNNLSTRLKACLRAEGRHSEHTVMASLLNYLFTSEMHYMFIRHLRITDMQDCFFLGDDEGITSMQTNSRQLRSLTNTRYVSLFKRLPSLLHLYIAGYWK
jgi:hypothetical protein